MPNGTGPDEEKIILNGGVAGALLHEICYTIQRHVDSGKPFSNTAALVEQANLIEDEVNKFRRMVLDGIGFEGPYPHSLTIPL